MGRRARLVNRGLVNPSIARDPDDELLEMAAGSPRKDVAERLADRRRERWPRCLSGGGRVEGDEAHLVGVRRVLDIPDAEPDLSVSHDVGVEANGFVALSLVGHVAASPDEADDASLIVLGSFADRVDRPRRTVWTNDALAIGEPTALLESAANFALDAHPVVGVEPRDERLERDRGRLRLEAVDPVELVGPRDAARGEVPLPAPDVCDLLGQRELSLDARHRVVFRLPPHRTSPFPMLRRSKGKRRGRRKGLPEGSPGGGANLAPVSSIGPSMMGVELEFPGHRGVLAPHTPARILVAEDDEAMRRVVVETLRKDGHDVSEAADGGRLLVRLSRHLQSEGASLVDLLVSDVRMPICTGLQIVEQLRAVRCRMPIILVTAFGDEDTRRRARAVGALLLDKPFEMQELRSAVEVLLRSSH